MSWIYVVLLAGAIAAVVVAEWPRLAARMGADEGLRTPRRPRRKRGAEPHLRLVTDEREEFAASVERDLEQLPTIEERDR